MSWQPLGTRTPGLEWQAFPETLPAKLIRVGQSWAARPVRSAMILIAYFDPLTPNAEPYLQGPFSLYPENFGWRTFAVTPPVAGANSVGLLLRASSLVAVEPSWVIQAEGLII